ncbi:integrase core domain-containing protein [Roseibium sp.]|uniref:integrase core domain-containing protein n=1 Tax=Roseibium sp. TaxID=1936156 RepID=UPI002619E904|nr:integrase core domain-containing protein [Roseibium sp.]
MDERLRFVARLLEGEKMAPMCREFGISRVTGYKIFERYKECGLDGLNDRSRRPYRQANKLPFQIERCILGLKREYPSWGAPKIRDKLIRQYCYPLTITDYRSRYLLACEGLTCTKSDFAVSVFERVFKEFGLPAAIRTDNGVPFASPHALFGLSKLSVWWLRLGIRIERIKPGHPQQNGRHERMHLTLKRETTKPAAFNFLQQQERFERFMAIYNNERPHQGLAGACPGDLYTPSARVYEPPLEPEYPFHDRTVRVTRCGRICIGKRKINLSQVFAGQILGLREVDDEIWLVSFLDYDLGYFDKNENRVEPANNPFAPEKV